MSKKIDAPMLLKALPVVFARAEEMCGGIFPPDEMAGAKAWTRAVAKETMSLVRRTAKQQVKDRARKRPKK